MITEMAVPLEVAAAAWLAALMLGVAVGRAKGSRRQRPLANRPAGRFQPGRVKSALRNADRPMAERNAAQAVLHARIDQIETLRAGWDPQTRAQILETIATVMKAGIRRSDSFAASQGDGFTIIMPGADERAAKGVAARLRHALAQIRLPQLGGTNPFTASFGVAAGPAREGGENLVAYAFAALEEAQKAGTDHIVAASEIREIMLLPAPDPSARAA